MSLNPICLERTLVGHEEEDGQQGGEGGRHARTPLPYSGPCAPPRSPVLPGPRRTAPATRPPPPDSHPPARSSVNTQNATFNLSLKDTNHSLNRYMLYGCSAWRLWGRASCCLTGCVPRRGQCSAVQAQALQPAFSLSSPVLHRSPPSTRLVLLSCSCSCSWPFRSYVGNSPLTLPL